MNKTRLEAFSDGVLAIIITIMVLELKVPHGESFEVLRPLLPVLLSYLISFIYIGIYWNNHHHLLHATKQVNGGVLWANLHLLFWLSLLPFVSGWLGENPFTPLPTSLYGAVLLMASFAYWILTRAIITADGPNSLLAGAIGKDFKGKLSVVSYLVAIPLAFVNVGVSHAIYVGIAMMWLIPDRRIERKIHQSN